MTDAAQPIRDLIASWTRATETGDAARLRDLMAEDVVFLVPGQPPLPGREAFLAGFRAAVQQHRIDPRCEIQEVQVAGEWAYCWTRLTVTVMPRQAGTPTRRTGYALTVLRRERDGRRVIARDANLLTVEA